MDPLSLLPPFSLLLLLTQRDELAVSDPIRSDSPTFKVFSLHHRHQSYAIHAKSKMKQEEWVGKIRQLTADDELEQLVRSVS